MTALFNTTETEWSTFTRYAFIADAVVFFNSLSGSLYPLRNANIGSPNHSNLERPTIEPSSVIERLPLHDQLWFYQNFMTSSRSRDLSRVEEMYNGQRDRADVMKITIMPTLTCNLKCSYCYAWKSSGSMEETTAQTIEDWLSKLPSHLKEVRLYWVGGEPTLAWERLAQTTRVAQKRCERIGAKFYCAVVSNGTALTPLRAAEMVDLGVKTLQISLDVDVDGHKPGNPATPPGERSLNSPAFPKIIRNITSIPSSVELAIRINVPRGANANVALLLNRISEVERVKDAGIYFSPIHYDGAASRAEFMQTNTGMWEAEFASQQLVFMKQALARGLRISVPLTGRNVCTAMVKQSIVIEPSGRIKKCWVDTGKDDAEIGYITPDGPIMSKPEDTYFLDLTQDSYDACRSCALLPLCFGGCQWRVKRGAPLAERCHPLKGSFQEYIEFLCESVWTKRAVYDGKTGILSPQSSAKGSSL